MFIPAYFIGSTARPCGAARQGATENCLGLASQARPRPETPMRILLLNGNTDPAITDLIAKRAQEALPRLGLPACNLVPATAPFGARYIATRAAVAIAGHAVLTGLAQHIGPHNPQGFDAAIIACFGVDFHCVGEIKNYDANIPLASYFCDVLQIKDERSKTRAI